MARSWQWRAFAKRNRRSTKAHDDRDASVPRTGAGTCVGGNQVRQFRVVASAFRLPRSRTGQAPRAVLHRLQGDLGQRPPRREAVGQCSEGDGTAGEVARYRRVFGAGPGIVQQPLV